MHVLLIEDNGDDAYLIGETLTERAVVDVQLEWVDRLESGLTRLDESKSDPVFNGHLKKGRGPSVDVRARVAATRYKLAHSADCLDSASPSTGDEKWKLIRHSYEAD